jgi:hypothetical protein
MLAPGRAACGTGGLRRRAAHEAPAKAIFNLRGGIFRWHAEGRPLEYGPGASGVHPFSRDWGRLLKRLG